MALHPLVEGFADAAEAYERGRPGYPQAAIAALGLPPGTRVADVGAGTGKLTRALVAFGFEVVAVEPIDGMRARLEAELPQVQALAGTAEALPLAEASVGGVVAGQAFHWFDHELAPREIARVLAPGGVLGIVFNTPIEEASGAPWHDELSALLATKRPAHPGHDADENERGRALNALGLFTPLEAHAFPNPFRIDRAGLLAHVASLSYIGALPAPERSAVLDDVESLLDRHGVTGEVELPVTTDLYTARKL